MRNDHHSSQISVGIMELEQCGEPLAIFGIQEVLQKWQLPWNCYGSVIIDRITRILLLSVSCSFHIADSNWSVMNFILVAIWSKQPNLKLMPFFFNTSNTIDRSWVITIVRLESFLCGCVGRYCPVLAFIHDCQKSLISPVIIFSLFNGCGHSLAVHIWVESEWGIQSMHRSFRQVEPQQMSLEAHFGDEYVAVDSTSKILCPDHSVLKAFFLLSNDPMSLPHWLHT